ncbi:MAG TPA: hypothetical protein VHE35_18550 [Kofleriaceae bacterium]|nr:hypothetical protein [Kofleriaceae bacterium]
MHLFVRAVITGFGLALGAALYRKVARELGIDDTAQATSPPAQAEPVPSGS